MSEVEIRDEAFRQLLEKMVAEKQLSPMDVDTLARKHGANAKAPVQTEDEVLRWLAHEYGLTFTTLEDTELDRQLLSLFPARILLKDEVLPLRRLNGSVEVATSRLFATQALDTL